MLLLLRGLLDAQSALDGNVAEVAPADDSASAVVVRAGEVVEVGAAADTGVGVSATSAVGVEGAAATESSGRSSQTSAMATELSGDPFFSNVSLLLHADGTDGSTTIADSSSSPKTLTANGDAQISTVRSKFGSASLALDGTGDYVTAPNSSDWDVGAGDFTLEMFVYVAALPSAYKRIFTIGKPVIAANDDASINLEISNTNRMTFAIVSSGAYYTASDPSAMTAGAWEHWAVVRAGTTLTLYRGGSPVGSVGVSTLAVSFSASHELRIGRWGSNTTRDFAGNLDEIRFTKGTARYTSSFTPPSLAFPDATSSSATDTSTASTTVVASAAITETSALVDAGTASTVATGALAELVAAIEVTAGASAVSRGSTEVTAAADAPSATRSTAALQSELGAVGDVQSAVRSALAEAAEVGIAIDEPVGATLAVSDLVEAASAGETVAATRLVPLAAIAEMVSATEFLQGIVFGAAGVSEGASALDGFEAIRYSTGAVNESPGSGYGNVGEVVDAIWRHRNALTVARYLTDGDGPLLTPVDIPPELADLVDAVWADTRALSQSKYQILKE